MNITKDDKIFLLNLARTTIQRELGVKTSYSPHRQVGKPTGVFVTLHKKGGLRGCIGQIRTSQTISETVEEMAISAAFKDPRFSPVTLAEMSEIDIEISILTPMKRIYSPLEVRVGIDGIYLNRGFSSGLLLPQVSLEQGWTQEEYLSQGCLKAGLPRDTWQKNDPELSLYTFEALVFGELEFLKESGR